MPQTTSKSAATKKVVAPSQALKSSTKKSAKSTTESAGEITVKSKVTKSKKSSTAKADKANQQSTSQASKSATARGDGASPVTAKRGKSSKPAIITSEQRYRMICEAAYYRAEQRGFINGNPEQDWLEAEREVDLQLSRM